VTTEATSHRGFTLVEALAVIAIIGGLLAIVLPSLGGARDAARDIAQLSALRQHAAVVTAYTLDWEDRIPMFFEPGATRLEYALGNGRVLSVNAYFEQQAAWPVVMRDDYTGGLFDGSLNPGNPYEGYFPTRFYLSASLLAEPSYWSQSTRRGDTRQLRSVRLSGVTFPASKALLMDFRSLVEVEVEGGKRILWAACDGSAGKNRQQEFVRPIPTGEGDFPWAFLGSGWLGLHTPGGALGRDVE